MCGEDRFKSVRENPRQIRSKNQFAACRRLLQALQQGMRKAKTAFIKRFVDDVFEEVTVDTRTFFLGESSLDRVVTKCSGNDPAGSSGVPASVHAVKSLLCRSGADPQFACINSAWLSSTIFVLPAILFIRHPITPS
jgi:hypothetical protein